MFVLKLNKKLNNQILKNKKILIHTFILNLIKKKKTIFMSIFEYAEGNYSKILPYQVFQ